MKRIAAAGLVSLLAAAAIVYFVSRRDDSPRRLRDAASAFDRGDYSRSLELAEGILGRHPENGEAGLLAGRSAAHLGRTLQAVEFFDSVSKEDGLNYVKARCEAGDLLLLKLHRLSEAEQRFRDALAVESQHPLALGRIAYLLGLTGRYFEQIAFRIRLIQNGKIEGIHLHSLAMAENSLENAADIVPYHEAVPDDAAPLITLARIAIQGGDYAEALRLLQQAVRAAPNLTEAQSRLGELLLEHAGEAEFLAWHSRLPSTANRHPGIWISRARWAAKKSNEKTAARCYAEAVRLDPMDPRANYQLGRLLVSLGRPDVAQRFLDRAKQIRSYVSKVKAAWEIPHSDAVDRDGWKPVREAAEIAESLGLYWESYAWSRLAAARNPDFVWARDTIKRLQPRLPSLPMTRVPLQDNPIACVDYTQYPLPVLPQSIIRVGNANRTQPVPARVTFSDRAADAGMVFHYFNGQTTQDGGISRMYQFSGGGVAILDYDGDGLPDVYLAQGCEWPPDAKQRKYSDRLFRNLGNGQFADVTREAGVAEFGFSQGVTVGDFNADGWPDIFVANIGENRLLRNNADGTFTDVTSDSGLSGGQWTTSCLMADLNGDGLPDLYSVNYVAGRNVFTTHCRGGGGTGICSPHPFPAEQDQLFLNLGDGRFRNVTQTAGIVAADGKGLGIVAADFDGTGRLGLFVANDTTPNFYFVSLPNKSDDSLWFREAGLSSGVALNGAGRAESGMGIAIGDADGDGSLDLFVTNFDNESNTFYRQRSRHIFEDETRKAGLADDSMAMVGFGTQFVDGDLDGRLDLVVTNGHIGDFRRSGSRYYKMPPQLFANVGNGRFQLQDGKAVSAYFRKRYLGRALARLDWNRDGREDLIITHLDAPVALLSNTTEKCGNFVAVTLRGVQSNRDAIGTTVTVVTPAGTLVRQMTAGDGYLASNERRLVFGLGSETRISELTVRWPSGIIRRFTDIAAGSDLLLIENQERTYSLPNSFVR